MVKLKAITFNLLIQHGKSDLSRIILLSVKSSENTSSTLASRLHTTVECLAGQACEVAEFSHFFVEVTQET